MKSNWPVTLSTVGTLMFLFDSIWILDDVFRLSPVASQFYFTGLPVAFAYPLLGAVLVLNLRKDNISVKLAAVICGIFVILDVLGFFSFGIPNALPTALCIAATVMRYHSQRRNHLLTDD
jgi:hypothetical protein